MVVDVLVAAAVGEQVDAGVVMVFPPAVDSVCLR